MIKVDKGAKNILFGWVICFSGGFMLFRRVILKFRKVVYCSGGLYAVLGGICCSGGLYGCSGGLYVEENKDVFRCH